MANDDRRPYVYFKTQTIEDRAATNAAGVAMYKDLDFIFIVPHGSEGKTELSEVYSDWLDKIKRQLGPVRAAGADMSTPFMMESRFPREWVDMIEKGYAAWKKGEELPVEGTALKQWAVLPPAMLANCIANHILTIEQLANASDEAINPIGMGIRMYRNRAQDWVKLNKEGDANKMALEINTLREDKARMEGAIADMRKQMEALSARIPATEPQRTLEQHEASKTLHAKKAA
jgi:hypothetical protein